MIKKLAHLNINTADLDRMMNFYSNTLGLDIKFKFTNQEGQTTGFYVSCGDMTFVEVFKRDAPATGGNGHYGHLCLEATDLQGLRSTLTGKGVSVTEIQKGSDNSYQMWITDPDGNRIEIMEYTPQSKQL